MAPLRRLPVSRWLAWSRRRPASRQAACGALALSCVWAAVVPKRISSCFVEGAHAENANAAGGPSGGPRFIRPHAVARFAEAPKLQEEPDIPAELAKMLKNTLVPPDEPRTLSVAQKITPIDRWFGWDKQMIENRREDDPFVDSSDELSYTTVLLEKPFGIEFVENPSEEGGGAMIGEVRPGYSAHACGQLVPGAHLIAANDQPVYGLPFEEAMRPMIDSEGPIKLTFFMGDAVYFYGEFRPSSAWLLDFMERLKEEAPEDRVDEVEATPWTSDDAQ